MITTIIRRQFSRLIISHLIRGYVHSYLELYQKFALCSEKGIIYEIIPRIVL